MYTNWCVLIEISMEIGMIIFFWLGLLVTTLTKEIYFTAINFNSFSAATMIVSKMHLHMRRLLGSRLVFKSGFCSRADHDGGRTVHEIVMTNTATFCQISKIIVKRWRHYLWSKEPRCFCQSRHNWLFLTHFWF